MKKKILLSVFFCLFLQSLIAKDRVFSSFFGDAVNGYDVVAYFLKQKPVKGNSKFYYEWEGAKWLFSSEKNLELFQQNPQKYAPQYGGFCAYAMAQGAFASTKPEAWSIVDEKLYLNYDLQIRKKWEKNQTHFIQFANENWKNIWTQ